jgi:hypothetical protein
VSTLDDLSRFYRALVGGRVLEPATLQTMLGEGMGIDAIPLGEETCYGHGGFWGVLAYHCPGSRVTLAAMVNQADGFAEPATNLVAAAHRLATE